MLCFVALELLIPMRHFGIFILIEALILFRIFLKCFENECLISLCNDIYSRITDNNIKTVDERQNRTDSGCVERTIYDKLTFYINKSTHAINQ